MSFIKELKRRNVFKVGIAYAITAWILLQLIDVVGDILALPEWVPKLILLLLAVGLVPALIFAWVFEMTPEGVKHQKDVDRSESITRVTGQKLNGAIIGVLVVALAYFAIDKFILTPGQAQPGSDRFSQQPSDLTTQPNEKSALTPVEAIDQTEPEPKISRQSIAVLPFDNRSRNVEDEYFTEGIHDDLLTNLARISSLKVISRTSVTQYKNTEKTIPVIAKELGVAHIMEGAVQRSGNTVRINVQLIDAETDEHLWAEIFDRELTAENLFAIQSEISEKIANALEATLSPEETLRINSVPTENLQAYDAYLRGRQLMASRNAEKLEQAIEEFERAVELDPGFALAWVGLADSNALLNYFGTLDPQVANAAREDAINQALKIDDQLGEAYASLGWLYLNTNRPQEAEQAFQKAIELSPNYATAYQWYGVSMFFMPLRSQQLLELAIKASELDPRSPIIGTMLGGAYIFRGHYSLAERQFKKVIELNPDFAEGYQSLVILYTFRTGQFDKAILASRKSIALNPGNITSLLTQAEIYLQLGDVASAESVRNRMEELGNQHWTLGWADVNIAQTRDNPKAVSEAINWVLPKLQSDPRRAQFAAVHALASGDKDKAREIFLKTNPGWIDPQQWQSLINRSSGQACVISWLLINTGDEALGHQLLKQTTQYLDVDLAAVDEHVDVLNPEICYLTAGDTEKALISIEHQLKDNHLFGWNIDHKMPMYEAIRFEPRYQAALAERERRIAVQREAIAKIDAEAEL